MSIRQIKCDSEIRKRTFTWIDEIILKPGSILKVVYFSMKKEILPTVYLGCDSFDRLWEKSGSTLDFQRIKTNAFRTPEQIKMEILVS